jgi:hypothetical protein
VSAAVDGVYVVENQQNNQSFSAFVHKYSLEGDPLWTRSFGSSGRHVSAAADGVYVWSYNPEPPGYVLRKFDPEGNSLWTRQLGWVNWVSAAVNGVYVVGGSENGGFIQKYDGNGNEAWARQVGPSTYAHFVSTTADGVYVAGSILIDPDEETWSQDTLIRKYNHQGNLLWTHQFELLRSTFATGVSATADGVYLDGATYSSDSIWSRYVRKYDPAGHLLWTQRSNLVWLPFRSWWCQISASAQGLFETFEQEDRRIPSFVSRYDPAGNVVAGVSLSAFLSEYHQFAESPIAASGDRVYLIGHRSGSRGSGYRPFLMMLISEPKSLRPVSWILPRSITHTLPNFVVQWAGSQSGGPAIQDYTIYVSDNGGTFTPWLTQTTATEGTFTGLPEHTYGFYSIARNQAGTYESPKTRADITIPVVAAPVSRVSPLPARQLSTSFLVKWSPISGALIQDYTIYVSDNGGPFHPRSPTTATQGTFFGFRGHTYRFYSIGRTQDDIYETPKTTAEATTRIVETVEPVSLVSALPGTASSPNFLVQWSGTDTGSGISRYTIYVSDNGGAYTAWLIHTVTTQAWFSGLLGHTYSFFSIARDKDGNQESMKSGAEATTQVPTVMAADVNGDLRIDCSDVAVVKASLGKKTGQLGFDPRADVNKDGVVDIRDLSAVAQKLAPTTKCL